MSVNLTFLVCTLKRFIFNDSVTEYNEGKLIAKLNLAKLMSTK